MATSDVIVAYMWTGARVMKPWRGLVPPTQDELDEIAVALTYENAGVKPVVRLVEAIELRAVIEPSGELPEEAQERTLGRRFRMPRWTGLR